MKMFKKCVGCVTLLAMIVMQMFGMVYATAVDGEQRGTITITLEDNGKNRADVAFDIYKFASAVIENGSVSFELVEQFANADVAFNIETAEDVEALIENVSSYITTNGVAPTQTGKTNAQGNCSFTDLELGMYVIIPKEAEEYGIIANSFVALPYVDESHNWAYEEHLVPKYTDTDITTPEVPEPPTTPPGPSPDEPILGIEDMSPYIGTGLLSVGIILFAMAMILLVRRRGNNG